MTGLGGGRYPASSFHPVFPAGSLPAFLFWLLAKVGLGAAQRERDRMGIPLVSA